MAKRGINLMEIDVEKLFEERKVEEIVEIAKLLDLEIERKRVELRSMVGSVCEVINSFIDILMNFLYVVTDTRMS